VYYPTHEFFLSARAVYIVVYNAARKDDPLSRVEYWLKKIQVFTRPERPMIFLVGTHLDELEKNKSQRERLDKALDSLNLRYNSSIGFNIVGQTIISCVSGKGVKELKDLVSQIVESSKIFPQVPSCYVQLANMIIEKKKDSRLLDVSWGEFIEWASSCSVTSEETFGAVQFLHDVGLIVHFHGSKGREVVLNDLVVLDPQNLVRERTGVGRERQREKQSKRRLIDCFHYSCFPL
jgi:hypothetical protein